MKRKEKEIAEDVEETIYMGIAWEGIVARSLPLQFEK
jgi:hypothetical protein